MYEFLEVKEDYDTWIAKMIEVGLFKEKKDYWIEKSDPSEPSDPKWEYAQK